MRNRSGIIYNEGLISYAILTVIDAYIENNDIFVPKGTPDKELTEAFAIEFNRIAPKGYKINLKDGELYPPWTSGYTDDEDDLNEDEEPVDEAKIWDPTDKELKEYVLEAAENMF